MTHRAFKKSEKGAAVAEFAVACLFFFTVLIGIIEFGRLLYTHNALTDAARRGARYATLHKKDVACVKNIVIYGEKHVDAECKETGPPLINGITAQSVTINVTYEGADTDNLPEEEDDTPIDTDYGSNLGTATVTIENFNFTLGIPLLNLTITMPDYRTTMTAESAGEEPADL